MYQFTVAVKLGDFDKGSKYVTLKDVCTSCKQLGLMHKCFSLYILLLLFSVKFIPEFSSPSPVFLSLEFALFFLCQMFPNLFQQFNDMKGILGPHQYSYPS